ncbi:acetyl-CoA carboxylase biotin carboxyl carrier protein subunit [Leptospira sp. GIMC2001]|uniref:acetyl-CoA carboxylase biotin carboxyl carrier protein subunit n=1 Tax=Leptospira sp. GIMC2001 TaxID=1513297 RepID=UPI00234A4F9B|nr:acetyl-CoA carboxylase biotin carboxyl carrier protein subunit [Leptospira sp. GIMC2001]WCL49025.1 acetyl-CoA carboxylase biotin carboxyl carrier protein subunit [Leptospira sp. GIMC2001]
MRFKFDNKEDFYTVYPINSTQIRVRNPKGIISDYYLNEICEKDYILPGPIVEFEDEAGTKGYFLRKKDKMYLHHQGKTFIAKIEDVTLGDSELISNEIRSPMPGKLIKLFKKAGDSFLKSDVLGILEAMKMENQLKAGFDGKILNVLKKEGDLVGQDEIIILLEPLT